MLQAIQATTDDVEKRKEIERSKRETQRRIAAGYYQERPPLGTRLEAAGEVLVPEWPTIMKAFKLLDEGESYRTIAEKTDLSIATLSCLADRGRSYYHDYHQGWNAHAVSRDRHSG